MVLFWDLHALHVNMWKAKDRESAPPCPSMFLHGKPEAETTAANPQKRPYRANIPGSPSAYMGVPGEGVWDCDAIDACLRDIINQQYRRQGQLEGNHNATQKKKNLTRP